MIIKNKLESIKIINELGLNKFKEELFKKNETEKVLNFINNNKAKYYAIRDKTKGGGLFKLKVLEADVLYEVKDYELFTINISSINYSDNQLLTGEIFFSSNNDVWLTVTTDKYASSRDATIYPEFNLKTNIFDKNLDKVPYFNTLYKYAVKHNLKDIIIEFALFDIEVGINNENIIIYELRSDY